MKKKVTLLCAVAAMGIAAAVGVSLQNRAQLSDVALANIEALASGEGEGGCKSIMTCPYDKDITCSGAERCVTDVQEMYIECDGTRYYCPR